MESSECLSFDADVDKWAEYQSTSNLPDSEDRGSPIYLSDGHPVFRESPVPLTLPNPVANCSTPLDRIEIAHSSEI